MKRQDFLKLMTELSLMSFSRVENSTRPLAAGFVPSGARGPHAPDIEPRHAGAMLCAFAATTLSESGDVAERLLKLRPAAQGADYPYKTFSDMLADNLGDVASALHSVEMSPAGDYAFAEFKTDGGMETVLFTDNKKVRAAVKEGADPKNQFCRHLGNLFVIKRGALDEITRAFNDGDEGWTADREAE